MSETSQSGEVSQTAGSTTSGTTDPKQGSNAPSIDSSTTVSTMGELKEKAPEVYKAIEQGIAMSMINQMHDANDRLIQRMKEDRYRNSR